MYSLNEAAGLTPEMISVDLLLIVLAGAIAVAAYRRGLRKSELGESAIWVFGTLIFSIVIGALYLGNPESPRYFLLGLLGFIWISAAMGCYRSWTRKVEGEPRSQMGRALDLFAAAFCLFAIASISLLPAMERHREIVNRSICTGHLKQIALAFYNHAEVNGSFPASANNEPPFSWRVAILPYLDQGELLRRYDFGSTWDSKTNEPIAKTRVTLLQCPSRVWRRNPKLTEDESGRFYTQYAMVTGPGTVERGVKLNEIEDGAANTMLVVEACGLDLIWTQPKDTNIATQPEGINLPGPTRGRSGGWISSQHPGGANVVFADGYVRFISDKIDPKVLRAMTTIDAKDDVGNF